MPYLFYELLLALLTALEVIWHAIIIGVQVQSKADPCGVCAVHIGSGAGFLVNTWVFLCITTPLLHISFPSDTTYSWQLTALSKLFSIYFTWKYLVWSLCKLTELTWCKPRSDSLQIEVLNALVMLQIQHLKRLMWLGSDVFISCLVCKLHICWENWKGHITMKCV
jgi:hypothetical protein